MNADRKVMIFAETANGAINPVFFEILSKAKEVFDEHKTIFIAALATDDARDALPAITSSGVDEIYVAEHPQLRIFHPVNHTDAMEHIVREADPDVLFIGASSAGSELAPALGVRLHTGVAAHCVDFYLKDDGSLAQIVPAFGGKVIGEIFTPDTRPQIASVGLGVFSAAEHDERPCAIRRVGFTVRDDDAPAVTIVRAEMSAPEKLPVEKAELVVCGGFGVGSREVWAKLSRLAEKLGGAVACTRPVVDEGWVDGDENMVGTSGKSIRPRIYLGIGISGATHHICGMKNSGTIISVNSDPDADMTSCADYTIIEDSETFIDSLLERL
jgi:electron transfer flavoprotein alpha subunit